MLNASRFSRGGGDQKTPFLVGKERELFESKKWPSSFSKPVDITKIRIDAFKPWITKRTAELMGVDDEIVVDYCISQLKVLGETDAKANIENAGDGGTVFNEKPSLDPKRLQINLTGFMAKKAHVFVKELWDLLLSAQENEYGIPQAFIDEKKREIENEANAELSSIKEDRETHIYDEDRHVDENYTDSKREVSHTNERRYKTERRRSSTPVRRGSYSHKDRRYDRHRTHRYKRSHSRDIRRGSYSRSSSSSQSSTSSYEYSNRKHRRHSRRESRRDRSSSSDYHRRSRRSRSGRRHRRSRDDYKRRRNSRYDSDSSPSIAPERLRGKTRNRS
ncbi:hypothetical protein BEWA_021050 [Theileria equi strain WA]|uniref:PWI domain-containing protein n=1 Tax=Theileria equi strain WA TaxID=1537102 RepID=L0AVI3_THEEQ|nr:hypothetical protein BEWA_021050 [Theileria equi strain WA]AFZ79258.1 hypothetical protein BEWA_021050 [Theileria equi strain WA]|eukprot:XP_004828924.1 hypothetical protein BEWA_021050 [Theileria equi strain WA]